MRNRATVPALLLTCCVASGWAAAETRQLTRIQYWSMGTSTRISVEFTGEFQYKADRLEKPGRIFFDIPNTTFALDGKTKGLHAVAVGDKLVKQIRVANPISATMTRVVLDLESEVLYTAAVLKNPDRLMIEVYPPGNPPGPGDTPSVSGNVTVTPATALVTTPPVPTPAPAPVVAPKKVTVAEAAPAPPVASDRVAVPAKTNMGGDRSLTRALGLKLKRIVLDPGHGGFDDGTTGYGGLKEKDLVLDIALRLGKLLKERLHTEIIYTRQTDQFVSLDRRTEIANEQHADLFLSIHANSSTVRSVTGVETYYLSNNGTKAALEVAARENATAEKTLGQLNGLLQQIALTDKLKESVEFAGRVQYALVTGTGPAGARARNRGVRRAPFIVLIGAQMPSILAEVGFLSNAQEEALMRQDEYRDKIAEALAAGIESYAQTLSKIDVARAPSSTGAAPTHLAAKPAPAAEQPAPLPQQQQLQPTQGKAPIVPIRRRGSVSTRPVSVRTPEAVAVRQGNGPKPSAARRARSGVSN